MKWLILALTALYGFGFVTGCDGVGYAGHGGYHQPASFWYWGGSPTYHDPSVRAGSIGGRSTLGGGAHGGK